MLATNRNLLAAVALVGGLVTSAPTQAHQQWLLPNVFSASGESDWVSFDHTFGDRRFHADSAPGLYYQWWYVGPDGRKRSVPHLFVGRTKIVGEVELTEPGTYRFEGEESNLVWTKIKVDGKDTWQPGPRKAFEGREIVESKIYFARALAYVSLESTTDTVRGATGDALEIVLGKHPNELTAGEALEISLWSFGEPVADHQVSLFSERSSGHDPTLTCTTDAKGACQIVPPGPGIYLVTARREGSMPDDPELDGFSHSVSVAFEVAPRASGPES